MADRDAGRVVDLKRALTGPYDEAEVSLPRDARSGVHSGSSRRSSSKTCAQRLHLQARSLRSTFTPAQSRSPFARYGRIIYAVKIDADLRAVF